MTDDRFAALRARYEKLRSQYGLNFILVLSADEARALLDAAEERDAERGRADRLAAALQFYAARSHFEGMVHIEHARPLACVTVSVEDGQVARAALAELDKQ